MPVLVQQLVGRGQECAGEIRSPRVGIIGLHASLERHGVPARHHAVPGEKIDRVSAGAFVEQARTFGPREALQIPGTLGQHFRRDGEPMLLRIEQKVLGVHRHVVVHVGVGGPEPVRPFFVLP